MYAKQLGTLLEFSLKNNFRVLIKGAPGIGKSEIVAQACERINMPLIISHPAVSDPTDYKGLPFMVDGEAVFTPFGDMKELINTKKPLVFFLDDLGQATPAVQSGLMQVIQAREVAGHKISPKVRFIAATNRREDKANVNGILEPVKSRFDSIVELEISTADWIDWAWMNGMPSELVSFIQFRPNMLTDFKASREIENSPSPRTIAQAGRMIKAGIPDSKNNKLVFETLQGAAGQAFAQEYLAYIKVFMSLPTISEIIKDPRGTRLPDNISGKYAMMGSIADNFTAKNGAPLITYLERLGNEMNVAALRQVAIQKPFELECPEFSQWAIDHQDLFV